jgi:hypothetical protein
MGLGKEVASRLAKLAYKGRQLTLKVMRRAAEAPVSHSGAHPASDCPVDVD